MSASSPPTIWWARRDLRLADNPALGAAVDGGEGVPPLFVLDPVLLGSAGTARRGWLVAALSALDADLREADGPGLTVRLGRPAEGVPAGAPEIRAGSVHVSADFGPYGRRRDERVAKALADVGVELRATGSPYAVAPGTLRTGSGTPFQVFSPFHRSWQQHGVHDPAPAVAPDEVRWIATSRNEPPEAADPALLPLAGERAARASWLAWLGRELSGPADYARLHNLPGVDATAHI